MNDFVQNVIDEYGLDTSDVNTDIAYEVSGGFTIDNADPTQKDAFEDIIRNTISRQAGVPVDDVKVAFNSVTGEVAYTLKTGSYNDSNGIKVNIKDDSFTDAIERDLEAVNSNIDITSPQVNDAIVADVSMVVDAKDSTSDITAA